MNISIKDLYCVVKDIQFIYKRMKIYQKECVYFYAILSIVKSKFRFSSSSMAANYRVKRILMESIRHTAIQLYVWIKIQNGRITFKDI